MNQLEDLKRLRIDRVPLSDGLDRAVKLGGARRHRTQLRSSMAIVAVAAFGVTTLGLWPSRSDTASISAATPPSATAPPASTSSAADQAVLRQLISVPDSAYRGVSTAGLLTRPTSVSGAPLTSDGKPEIFYYGAEYAPYAAAQRWPLILALSRFGTWSTLNTTTSALDDVFPLTPTFTFHNSVYSSPYLSFQSVETSTNQRINDATFAPLETPTAEQTALVQAYDSAGSIPFIDFGNKSVLIGSSYSPDVLAGKSLSEIASSAADPSTDVGRSILATANTMTAAICALTGAQPASVCG